MNTTEQPEYTHIIDDEDDDELIKDFTPFGKKVDGNVSFATLYSKLIAHGSIFVEIRPDQIAGLRKGLSEAKYRTNEKIKLEGLDIDERRIQYERVEETKDKIKVKISFADNGITLLSLTIDNSEKEI